MKFILIFGASAAGKMTIGQELAKITDLKLFHNHLSIELAYRFFDFGTPEFRHLNNTFREEIFKTVAASDLYGIIFTLVWALGHPGEAEYVERITNLFEENDGTIYYVELTADPQVRAQRNHDPHRLLHKPSKRNLENSARVFWRHERQYRFNTLPNEFDWENYLKIETDKISAVEAAALIKKEFDL